MLECHWKIGTSVVNKGELIKEISEKSGATLKDTKRFLNAFIEAVSKAMKKGDDVALVGFGTFSVTERAERIGRNFKTGKKFQFRHQNL